MASIVTEVVKIISDVSGSVVSDYNSALSDLNLSDSQIGDLAGQLNDFVSEKSNGAASVSGSDISPGNTVQDVIDLVSNKLGD